MAHQQELHDPASTAAAHVAELAQFHGPPETFLQQMLATQCRLAPAEAAVLWHGGDANDDPQPIAMHPPPHEADAPLPAWAQRAIELVSDVAATGNARIEPVREPDALYGLEPERQLILLPLWGETQVRGVAGFLVRRGHNGDIQRVRERLELTAGLLGTYELRLTLQQRQTELRRLRGACEVLAAVNAGGHFRSAAMALCNELATRFDAERVSLGFARGRCVKVLAMSHTEKIVRKMQLVQAIESAMEECLDQNVEISHPLADEAPVIGRAAETLASRHGPSAVVSLPVRRGGEAAAVLTLERDAARPFTMEEVQALRLTVDLCGSRLIERHDADRWFGARWAGGARAAAAWAVGPEQTWVKLSVIGVATALALALFVHGPDRVRAPFVVETTQRQVVAAPFEGYLATVHVEPGDVVEAGVTTLATLEVSALELEAAAQRAELSRHRTEAELARREGELAQAQMAEAQADQIEAELRLLEHQLDQAEIVTPVDALVLEGDRRGQAGAPVERGEVLFELAPLDDLRVRLQVPEQRIAAIERGQRGELAAAAHPGDYLPFEVTRIHPVAAVENGRNVFTVRGALADTRSWLRPQMEGAAKVEVGEAPYAWLWTRDMIHWVRMTLWW